MKRYIVLILTLAIVFSAFEGCVARAEKGAMPEDFSFYIRWGCYGVSSYASETEKLVKTTDATTPSDYVTTLALTDSQRQQLWEILGSLDLTRYPSYYNPNEGQFSTPDMTLVLSVTANGIKHTVTCRNISYSFSSSSGRGQDFLTACKQTIDILTATPEWNALPEYERVYS